MSFSARNIFKILSSFLMQKSPLHEEVCVPEETTAGLWGPLPDSHVVLFLDFDGVCHRCKNETFERMPLVEKLLDKCPSMVIVISSSWRECASITYLKSLFRLPYRDKVIGATDSVYLNLISQVCGLLSVRTLYFHIELKHLSALMTTNHYSRSVIHICKKPIITPASPNLILQLLTPGIICL